jgi:ssDNA-binding Zn-finger/Zn-ribbon topoisomerase 1
METIVLDTLGKLYRYGHGMFGWCAECGSPSRYWADVKARRTPKPAMFDNDLAELMRERGRNCVETGLEPIRCPRCGSRKTETRVTAPAKPRRLGA